MYSPSIHQLWLLHLIILRSLKATRMLDNSEVHSLFYFFLQKVTLYSWILYCAVDMSPGICWLTWLTCWLILLTLLFQMRLGQHVDLTVAQYVDMRVLLYISQFQHLSPHPGNLPSKAKKMLMPGGKPGGWGEGGGCLAGRSWNWLMH